jgi:hypothetical protein
METTRPVFRVEFEALASDVPAHVRLRRLLKFALRGCGLRCVRAEEGGAAADQGTIPGGQGTGQGAARRG